MGFSLLHASNTNASIHQTNILVTTHTVSQRKQKKKASVPAAPLTPAAQSLLLRHPELLLQDAQTIEDKLMGLQVSKGVF